MYLLNEHALQFLARCKAHIHSLIIQSGRHMYMHMRKLVCLFNYLYFLPGMKLV